MSPRTIGKSSLKQSIWGISNPKWSRGTFEAETQAPKLKRQRPFFDQGRYPNLFCFPNNLFGLGFLPWSSVIPFWIRVATLVGFDTSLD